MHGVMCIGKRVNAKVRNYWLLIVRLDMDELTTIGLSVIET